MKLMLVRDLATGESSNRPDDTPTLDVPLDFPRASVVSVTDGFRASYTASGGKPVTYSATPRPLSWRTGGERCLVARSGGAARRLRHYRLCVVERFADATTRRPDPAGLP
jgi:hypothetical protein